MPTKKDFEAVAAAAVRAERPASLLTSYAKGREAAAQGIAESLADYFAETNPRFDRDQFMAATGGYGEARTVSPVRVLRVAHGMTQAELAEAAGISCATVISIEKGTALPRLRTARAVAHVLRCEVLDLFPGLLPEGQR